MLLLLSACFVGVNPKAIPTQEIYLDDGQSQAKNAAISFAVIGDTREAGPGDRAVGRVPVPGAEKAIAADVSAAIEREGIEFVAFTGNMVASSSTLSWQTFSRDWRDVLAGSELSESGAVRVRALPAAGVGDRGGDARLRGWGASFPGVGADIGFNRIASWYALDLETRKKVWRVLVLDSNREALGSRWDEQLTWIPKALQGEYHGVIVLMSQPVHTLALKGTPDEEGGPGELLATVEDACPVGALKVIFAGNSGANEVFLPGGRYGELYVNAASGAPAATFARWGIAEQAEVRLESMYDLALIRAFDRWSAAKSFPEAVVDHAKARGTFEGFQGAYDANYFPNQGWWNVTLAGDQLTLTLRGPGPDGVFGDVYSIRLQGKEGWTIGS